MIDSYLNLLRPPKNIGVWEWANTYRILSSKSAAVPGKFSGAKTPYLKEVYDALSPDSQYQEVVLIKSTQVGGTEIAYNLAGYHMHIDPCPILYVLPKEEICKEHSKMRLDPMISDTPEIKRVVPEKRGKEGGNSAMIKDFMGGVFSYATAGSPDSLRSKPIRILIMDEISALDKDLKGEGDPLMLAKKRTNTFPNKKIYLCSTPGTYGQDLVTEEYEKTDQNEPFVPCPLCGAYQTLEFEGLAWEKGNYEDVKYQCSHCQELIHERYKPKMYAKYEWRPTHPELASKKRIGFRLNGFYSPLGWLSWGQIAQEYDEALLSEPKMKSFINTNLALSYKEKEGNKPEWQRLHERFDNVKNKIGIPDNEVCFITSGIDVQGDRLEVYVNGWGEGKRNWCVEYAVLVGDTDKPEVWEKLKAFLNKVYIRNDGVEMPIVFSCIDSQYNTRRVHEFCQKYDTSKVVPIQGREGLGTIFSAPKTVSLTEAGKKIGKTKVYGVGVSILKSELYGWLKLDMNEDGTTPPCFCHFPQMDQHFFKSITAESLVSATNKKGYSKLEWRKDYQRNEVLDTFNYSRAAASIFGMDRFTQESWSNFKIGGVLAKKTPEQKKKSDYWESNNKDYWA